MRKFELTDRVVIVTGSGTGIGKAVAINMAQAGANVVLAGLNMQDTSKTMEELESVASIIRDTGRKVISISADMRKVGDIERMVSTTIKEFGRIDVLVNNAGSTFICPSLELSEGGWNSIVQENLTSVFLCCREAGKIMKENRGGVIVNMASVTGQEPYPKAAPYAAAKAGVISLTKTLAFEWAQYNIRVNAIAPGPVDTPGSMRVFNPNYERNIQKIALRRMATTDEIGGVAVFLACDASSYITAQTITVDGGLTDMLIL